MVLSQGQETVQAQTTNGDARFVRILNGDFQVSVSDATFYANATTVSFNQYLPSNQSITINVDYINYLDRNPRPLKFELADTCPDCVITLQTTDPYLTR